MRRPPAWPAAPLILLVLALFLGYVIGVRLAPGNAPSSRAVIVAMMISYALWLGALYLIYWLIVVLFRRFTARSGAA